MIYPKQLLDCPEAEMISLPQWVEVKGTDNNGKSVSELLNLVGWNCTGFVIDDYISGANVFFDANKNGVIDPNEPKGITDSQAIVKRQILRSREAL